MQDIDVSTSTVKEELIPFYANYYGINEQQFEMTLSCESGFNSNAVGDKNTSFGVAQIHLPAHPEITKEQALNPFFSINWAAQQFSLGRSYMWSCYKKLAYDSS